MPKGRSHYRIRLADALVAHNTALSHGGVPGILNQSSVESAIARPYNGYYRSIWKKAAALIESVCRNHGFADGNKRTCVILLFLLLERSGYTLRALPSEDINDAIEDMTVAVADGRMSFDEIGAWVKARIKKKPSR